MYVNLFGPLLKHTGYKQQACVDVKVNVNYLMKVN